MCAKETHQFCNAFVLVMMCKEGRDGNLVGFHGEELTSIDELVKDISDVRTLEQKPKLFTIQAYTGKFKLYTGNWLRPVHTEAIFSDCNCDSSHHNKWVVQDSMEVFTLCDCDNLTSSNLAYYKQKQIAVTIKKNTLCE